MQEEVSVESLTLGKLFSTKKLTIPEYQRIYSWQEKNVHRLLDDIWNLDGSKTYHLGSIILQIDKDNNSLYNIIDGQQRLVTLSLILSALNDDTSPLLNETIESSEAVKFIQYNKFLIHTYISRYNLDDKAKEDKISSFKSSLKFAVLILESSSLDLAYTFFSNQNRQGVPLTNYDLLKSHHLRYITDEHWAKHLAQGWDKIIKDRDEKKSYKIDTTIGLYIFRLRNWLYHKKWDEGNRYNVKEEFEAASTIIEIPPFGEQFNFNESIQGGSHFFAFVNYFIEQCKNFQKTYEFDILKNLTNESHFLFREVMEAILFAYYLKFGTLYFSEALICISRVVSQTRFEKSRVWNVDVYYADYNNQLVGFIDKATSPTFFLAECKKMYSRFPLYNKDNARPIQKRYRQLLKNVHSKIDKANLTESFNDERIEE